MKKILIAISFLLLIKVAPAQDLVKKIPGNAFTVATIKGDNVFKLMFIKDFNESFLGKKLLTETSKSLDKDLNSIEDFGINLEKSMYYFNQFTDSISYNCFLIPLKDPAKFENLIRNKNEKVKTSGDVNTLTLPDSSSLLMWNKNMMYFVSGSIRSSFFADSVKSAKYGIKDIRYQNSDDTMIDSAAVAVDSTYVMDAAATAAAPEVYEEVKKPAKKTIQKKKTSKKTAAKKGSKKKPVKKKAPKIEEVEEIATATVVLTDTVDMETPPPPAYGGDRYDEYQGERKEQEDKKKRLAYSWMTAQANTIFNGNYESIASNKSYTNSLDDQSIASIWVSSLQDVYNMLTPELGAYSAYGKAGIMKGYGSLTSKLFMDKQSFRISAELEMAQEQADAYKKIMNRKLNKNFLKYVNSEKAIGFVSYAIDTKAYLEEFPKLMKQTYGTLLGAKMDEEIELGTDLFSLLLDEEAVSKVVKGDALFVINGLNTKDVAYTSYDYDDDYNRTEVKKMKKETLPDFLFMFSSEDTKLFQKLIKYGVNKSYVIPEQGIYKLKETKSPIDVYFMIKDGIVFFGNSLTEMQNIYNNQFNTSISKKHKDLLSKNNFSMLFNPKNLIGKVPDEEFGGAETAEKFNNTLSKMGDVYMKSNPIKGNIVSGEVSAEIPNGHENALKYLFSLIENATK
ncbi:hypothetical protein [Pedobacter punctiformis]|uniref:DUF4836 domain-containing protein n=1 Tax=Pedobacter punctiformis TaxID=3004097 RepID=A0ABT4L953_9SPHI|nr:hypothetical protein [Pedobacter sp. HCMS5-2]MCZ4244453.1 hypothetical protein [Pedobacter sp. HCMS5-2]